MDYANKVVVITGGANGIGLCIAREFAAKKSKIAIIDMDGNALLNAVKELQKCGTQVISYEGDISEENVLIEFAGLVIKTYGHVDYLINNACLNKKGILSGCSYDEFNYVFKVGVTAPYMLSLLFYDYFNINGVIINIASIRAFMSQKDNESYAATKGGIISLTHALAISLAGKVRVNSISPGWIDTSKNPTAHSLPDRLQHPVQRIGKPSDIAQAVLFLCNDENGFITGENINIDGGMTKLMIFHNENGWLYKEE